MNRDNLTPKQQAELDDKIFAAKKRAERAGYKVIMPGEGGNTTPAGKPTHTMSRQAYAHRLGGPANRLSMADRLGQLAQAAQTAEEAGYRVRKATPVDRLSQAVKTAEEAGYRVRKATPEERAALNAPQTVPAATPPIEPEKTNSYFAAAARFCTQED